MGPLRLPQDSHIPLLPPLQASFPLVPLLPPLKPEGQILLLLTSPLSLAVIVLLKQTGDAPIVKTSKVKVGSPYVPGNLHLLFRPDGPQTPQIDREKEFKEVVQFLSKQLRRDSVVRPPPPPSPSAREATEPLPTLAVCLPEELVLPVPGREGDPPRGP